MHRAVRGGQHAFHDAQAVNVVCRGEVDAGAVRAVGVLAREVGGDAEGGWVFAEKAAGNGGVLDVVRVGVGADVGCCCCCCRGGDGRGVFVCFCGVGWCRGAGDGGCGRHVCRGFGEGFEGVLKRAQGAEGGEGGDVPGGRGQANGFVGEGVEAGVDGGEGAVGVGVWWGGR